MNTVIYYLIATDQIVSYCSLLESKSSWFVSR